MTQLGQLELNAGDYAEAAAHFGRARLLRPDDANVAMNQGEALSKTGDLAGAKAALEASLKINPGQYRGRFLLGSVCFALHEFNAAQDQLEAALLMQSTFEAQKKLAEVFLAQDKFENARQQLEGAIKAQPDSAEAYELLARAYAGLGKTESASKARTRAKALAPPKSNKPTGFE